MKINNVTVTLGVSSRRPNWNRVDNKWVFTIKCDGERQIDRPKTRLVAKGKLNGFNYSETYFPVAKMTTV